MSVTLDDIIDKTKSMLGENYRGDTTTEPVYSTQIALENYTNSYMAVCNDTFTDDEIDLINEKTNNYAWWVANHGYLVDSSQNAISALIIYGSEEGSTTPDVLNFNGSTTDNFYNPINRTDTLGNINSSTNHVYVSFTLDDETVEYEVDAEGTPTVFTINEVEYTYYSGRLYPEDIVVIDSSVVYPIYLISNLEYYYIPVVGELGTALEGAHSAEQVEQNNLEILQITCEMVATEAAQWTNRDVNKKLLNECWPVIVRCACIAYLNRGAEGLSSQTELGQQNSYNDWVKILHGQITNRRYVV